MSVMMVAGYIPVSSELDPYEVEGVDYSQWMRDDILYGPQFGPGRRQLERARLCGPFRHGRPGILGGTMLATIWREDHY